MLIFLAPKISSQMFYIDWSHQTVSQVDCQYRALHEIVIIYELVLIL
jgi:hypothetical protein